MHFSLFQSCIILSSFVFSIISILIWHYKDRSSNKKNSEFLPTLISVFFWSAFLGLLMKIFLDVFFLWEKTNFLFSNNNFKYLTLLLEELVKAIGVIIGLEMANKRFNEISDGVIFGLMSAFGFIFFENILFLWEATGTKEAIKIFLGRNILSYSAHVFSSVVFGFFYASAYLGKVLIRPEKHKPYQIFRSMWVSALKYRNKKSSTFSGIIRYLLVLFKVLTLHIIIFHIVFHKKTRGHYSGELIMEGFLLSYYLHLFYDFVLETGNKLLNTVSLTFYIIFPLILFINFSHIEKSKNLLKS